MSKISDFIAALREDRQERAKLWLPVLFGTGIGFYFLLGQEPSKWLTLSVIETLILLAVLFRHYPAVLRVLFAAACVTAGFADAQIQTIYRETSQRAELPGRAVYVRGRVIKADYNIKGNRRLIFDGLEEFDGSRIDGRYRITLRGRGGDVDVGDCVEMVARVQPLAKAVLPGGYQFDRKNFYDGYSGSGYALSPVYRTDCPQDCQPVRTGLDSWRQKINRRIFKILPPDEAAIAAALITGERTLIPQRLTNQYRDSGLAHFLSISGLHMSMIAGLMFFLVRLILVCFPAVSLRFDSKKIAAVSAVVISAVYLGLSGAEVPAVRAFIMTFIVLLGVLFNRRAISMYTIAVAAMIILVAFPHALVGASFQMSFAAVVCLVAFYERYAGALSRFLDRSAGNALIRGVKILLLYFVGVLVSDLVASLATLPFAVYHFNRIALYTSLANLSAAPLIGFVIMPFVLLSLLAMPFGLEQYPLRLVGFGLGEVNRITDWVSSLDGASYLVVSEPLWGLLLIVFGGLWLCIWQGKIRRFGWLGIVIGLLSIGTVTKPDVLISADAGVIALKDNHDRLVVLPSRGKNFIKQQWLEKTASKPLSKAENEKLKRIYKGKETAPEWLDLQCTPQFCVYKGKFRINKNGRLLLSGKTLNPEGTGGMAVYMGKELKIKTVREDIGRRLWNLN